MADRMRMIDLLDRDAGVALDRWQSAEEGRAISIYCATGLRSLCLHGPGDRMARSESYGERTWPELVADAITEWEQQELDRASSERAP